MGALQVVLNQVNNVVVWRSLKYLMWIIIFTINACNVSNVRVRKISTYSIGNSHLNGDTVLISISIYNRNGQLKKETFSISNISYKYIYNKENEIIEIIKKEGSKVIETKKAIIGDNGEIMPYKPTNPPRLRCGNEFVKCIYNEKGELVLKEVIDERNGIVYQVYFYKYKYFNLNMSNE